jgi:hypothetical protein
MNHSTPAAVILSVERYEALLEEVEDLKDRLSIDERTGETIPAGRLWIELGLTQKVSARAKRALRIAVVPTQLVAEQLSELQPIDGHVEVRYIRPPAEPGFHVAAVLGVGNLGQQNGRLLNDGP